MNSFLEMLKESRTKRERNTVEDHLRDIATFLAILCDEINDLRESVNSLDESVCGLDV